jgi:hypothetical protein
VDAVLVLQPAGSCFEGALPMKLASIQSPSETTVV